MWFFVYTDLNGNAITQEYGPFATREDADMAACHYNTFTIFRWRTYIGRQCA